MADAHVPHLPAHARPADQGQAHGHDHAHAHGSSAHAHGAHGHHHHHAPARFGRAFAIGAALNVGFVVAEAVAGVAGDSVALLADAGHNLGDVLALLVAWGAACLAQRRPDARYTYGFGSASILAALFNGLVLLVVTGGVAWEAIRRLAHPEPSAGGLVMAVAAVGIVVNGVTAALFASGREHDLNVRGAFLHMLSDALVSAGVVVAGGLILLTGRSWIDPVASLLVSAVIVWGTWGLLRQSVEMVMGAAPEGLDTAEVRACLARLPGVARVHDLHVWHLSTTETALTCHLVMPEGPPGDAFLGEASHTLRRTFGIGHATLQVECDEAFACPLEPEHVV